MTTHDIDLHGFTVPEAMQAFINHYNTLLKQGKPRFTVIHGYGSTGAGGEIKKRLRAFLLEHSDKTGHIPGESEGKNAGYTLIIPRKPLPSVTDLLGEQILAFCDTPKTKEKIMGKFRNEGDPKVNAALKNLLKANLLNEVQKGKFKCYVSA